MADQVDFSELPLFANADELETQAHLIASTGQNLKSAAQDSRGLWQGLAAVYSAPESHQALAAFDQVDVLGTEASVVTGLYRDALLDFVAEVRALKLQAEELRTAAGQVQPDSDGEVDTAEIADLQMKVRLINADYFAAETHCASAIRAAAGLTVDSGVLGSDTASVVSGTVGGTLERVHRSPIQVRTPTVNVTGAIDPSLRLEDLPYDVSQGGVRYTRTPSGLLVPVQHTIDVNRPPINLQNYARPRSELRLDRSVVTPPGWASKAGKGLLIVDVGITAWDKGSDQYNEDLSAHPEWNDSQRAASAAENVAIVGGSSLAVGAAGAWAGAKIGMGVGAAIGSIIPGAGTAAGAAIGCGFGIAGGVVGGILGSKRGEKIGEKIKEKWDNFWDWP